MQGQFNFILLSCCLVPDLCIYIFFLIPSIAQQLGFSYTDLYDVTKTTEISTQGLIPINLRLSAKIGERKRLSRLQRLSLRWDESEISDNPLTL